MMDDRGNDRGNDRDNWKIVGFPMGQMAHYYNYLLTTLCHWLKKGPVQTWCPGTGTSLNMAFFGWPGTGTSSRGSTWAPCPGTGTNLNRFSSVPVVFTFLQTVEAPTPDFVADFSIVNTFFYLFMNMFSAGHWRV